MLLEKLKFLASQINKNLHDFIVMVNGNVLTGHNLLHLSLTPGQMCWHLGVNRRIKLIKKFGIWAGFSAFLQRAG